MFRKELFIAKQNRKREIASFVITSLYGVLLGFVCSLYLFED
jgi:hypothetical protein